MMEATLLTFKNMGKKYYLFLLICSMSACCNHSKSTADIICGGGFRYWYSSYSPRMYYYFDINGRKEQFCVDRFGIFEEFKMPDVLISGTWKPFDDSIILLSGTKYLVKVIDDETIILRNDTLHVLKDYKYIPKEYQKILGKDIKTGGFRSRPRITDHGGDHGVGSSDHFSN